MTKAKSQGTAAAMNSRYRRTDYAGRKFSPAAKLLFWLRRPFLFKNLLPTAAAILLLLLTLRSCSGG